MVNRRALDAINRRLKEALPRDGGQEEPEPYPLFSETVYVQITSTTQTDGKYPGTLYYRKVDGTYAQIGDAASVWVDTPNGESLSTSTYYRALPYAVKLSDSKVIFDVLGTAGAAPFIRGKLDGALSFGGSATMSIWAWNGSAEADTTENVTVYDWLLSTGQSIASGKQVTAAWDERSSRYYVTGAQCA